MKKLLLPLLAFLLLLFPPVVFAHPGRTAADGCHYCRTNCDYWGVPWNVRHCHGGTAPIVPEYSAPKTEPTPTPTRKPTPTPTLKPKPSPTPTSTLVPTLSPTPTPTQSPSPIPTPEVLGEKREESASGSGWLVLLLLPIAVGSFLLIKGRKK